jgi:hypothetical protein
VGQGVPAVLAIMLVAIGTRSPYAATSLAFAAGILNCDVKNLGQIGACEVIHVAVLENGSPYLLHKYTPHEIHGQTVPWGYN